MMEITMYSVEVPGDERNHNSTVKFDKSGRSGLKRGYLGISQIDPTTHQIDRVLLSPTQIKALLKFLDKPIRVEGME